MRARRVVETAGLSLAAVLLLRSAALECYIVPTGSMAPAILGVHKVRACPRCGSPVVVGRRDDPDDPRAAERLYASAACANCGCDSLGLEDVPECSGDRLLVNKWTFDFRRPRRWEVAVFRSPADPGKVLVKRVVGLPGETVQVRDGDVYINGRPARKTLAECQALRIPVLDTDYPPDLDGWAPRWEADPPWAAAGVEGATLRLSPDGDGEEQWLVYRHRHPGREGVEGVTDVCPYNGCRNDSPPAAVHDFLVECELEVLGGNGWLAVGLDDGLDQPVVRLPVGVEDGPACLVMGRDKEHAGSAFHLAAGQSCRLEMAFVDRRVSAAVNGRSLFPPVDYPDGEERDSVSRPVRVGSKGVRAVVRRLRLFRDVHYTAAGSHGGRLPVHLGTGEYFVLGDNSPCSEDSRFWRNPAVPADNLVGKPLLVHWPSRAVSGGVFGWSWHCQVPDWGGVRGLR